MSSGGDVPGFGRRFWGLCLALCCLMLARADASWAKEAETPAGSGGDERPLSQEFWQKKHELQQLKRQDPEAFRMELEKVREQVNEDLMRLKEEDPEKYRQIMQMRSERVRDRLESLKVKDPAAYEELMRRRPPRPQESES